MTIYMPNIRNIINHIQVSLTKQKNSPIHILLINVRCIHQVKMLNKNETYLTNVHLHCATLTQDKLHTNLGITFIWYNYIRYIMQYSNKDEVPTKDEALKYVLDKIQNFTRAVSGNPVCIELIRMIQNMNA